MSYLTKRECLKLDIVTYNKAMELQWPDHKKQKNLSGDLSICKHCGRKYVICCICDESEKRWDDMIAEVKAVSEERNKQEDEIQEEI